MVDLHTIFQLFIFNCNLRSSWTENFAVILNLKYVFKCFEKNRNTMEKYVYLKFKTYIQKDNR